MTPKKLDRLKMELEGLRSGSHRALAFQALARKLGRKQNGSRGKEPMWESQPFPDLFPLAIPDHGGGRDVSPGVKRSILNLLEADVARWDEQLANEHSDNEDDVEDPGEDNGAE
jgi:hypothetical protein